LSIDFDVSLLLGILQYSAAQHFGKGLADVEEPFVSMINALIPVSWE
jgi:hypothetical protein